jgi:hypothetical protein
MMMWMMCGTPSRERERERERRVFKSVLPVVKQMQMKCASYERGGQAVLCLL